MDASSELTVTRVRIEHGDVADPMSGCSLEESVWDVTLLVGIPHQGRASSPWAVMLMLVSVLVQGIFVLAHRLAIPCPEAD